MFMKENNPEQAQPTAYDLFNPEYFTDPNNWSNHLRDTKFWLRDLGREELTKIELMKTYFDTCEMYGFITNKDDAESVEERLTNVYSRDFLYIMHLSYTQAVIRTAILDPEQKAELLMLTATSMEESNYPVKGRAITLKRIKYEQKRGTKHLQEHPEDSNTYDYAYVAQLSEVESKFKQKTPKLKFGTIMKRIVAAETGEEPKNIFDAWGKAVAISEYGYPNPERGTDMVTKRTGIKLIDKFEEKAEAFEKKKTEFWHNDFKRREVDAETRQLQRHIITEKQRRRTEKQHQKQLKKLHKVLGKVSTEDVVSTLLGTDQYGRRIKK